MGRAASPMLAYLTAVLCCGVLCVWPPDPSRRTQSDRPAPIALPLRQVALSRQTTCSSAFTYLMGKAKAAAALPRALDISVAAGDAAHLNLTSPPPALAAAR